MRCDICKSWSGKKESVPWHGIYGSNRWKYHYYHPDCVTSRLADPERYAMREVDMAIEICDLVQRIKVEAQKIEREKASRNEVRIAEAKSKAVVWSEKLEEGL